MNKTNVVSAGAQEVIEITGDVSAAPWLGAPDADPESVGAAPFDPLTGLGAVGSLLADPAALRVNFQPATTDTPDGWRSDTGRAYAGQADGKTYGWESLFGGTPAPMPVDRDRIGRPLYDTLGFLTRSLIIPQQWSIALPNGTYPVVIMVGDASSRVHTDSLLINGQFRADPTPWDGQLTNGYEQGQFDAITAQVTVTTGKLTIRPAWLAGAFLPRINFIEIGSIGTTLDAATIARAQAAALLATQQTGLAKPKTPPLIKRNIWSGGYVDELASYTLTKPRKAAVRYFAHSNHLFSISAVTNSAGQVVERYSYNAYGVRTVKNPANVVIAKSVVGNDRGFTSYKLDGESGIYFARTRYYNAKNGFFLNRTSWNNSSAFFGSMNYSWLIMDDFGRFYMAVTVNQSLGTYMQRRYSLYDYASGDPANHLEPYSSWFCAGLAGLGIGIGGWQVWEWFIKHGDIVDKPGSLQEKIKEVGEAAGEVGEKAYDPTSPKKKLKALLSDPAKDQAKDYAKDLYKNRNKQTDVVEEEESEDGLTQEENEWNDTVFKQHLKNSAENEKRRKEELKRRYPICEESP